MIRSKSAARLSALAVAAMVMSACGQPQVVEKIVEKPVEVIKEVIKEVPKEVIKEVIKEVPGKEVIKEVVKNVNVEVTAVPAKKPFEGVTINALTFSGPQIKEPMQRRGKEFAALTGATVNVIDVPFGDLYQKLLNDWSSGTNSYDVAVFDPQWMGDYVNGGFLEELDARIKGDTALDWNDVGLFFRDFSATYNGKTYTIPLDGDFQMVYYRTDIAQQLGLKAPNTWEEYIAFAKAVSAKSLKNDDGKPVYGSCIGKKKGGQAYWFISSIASAYLQSQGTGQGGFFDLDTFQPLYGSNEGFKKALEVYKETSKYAPADEINLDVGDTRGLWTGGQCALTIDWGDIGPLAIAEGSKVNGKTGAVILPGSKSVLDRKTGKLAVCTAELCPYAENGVNHAPFAAFGGWSGAINKNSKPEVKDAAYAYLSYMNNKAQSNADVTVGSTGFNPYRNSQFLNRELWVKSGMSIDGANNYLGAIESSLKSPNMVLDLRIPQNVAYQGVVLDGTIAKFLAGELDIDATMKEVADGWNAKSDEIGRDGQLAAYKSTLGVQK